GPGAESVADRAEPECRCALRSAGVAGFLRKGGGGGRIKAPLQRVLAPPLRMAGPTWSLLPWSPPPLAAPPRPTFSARRPRALIDYAELSEIEQVEDIHRDELDKALARCPAGPVRERCQAERRRDAEVDWNRKVAEIKARYQKMKEDFEERCRASLALGPGA